MLDVRGAMRRSAVFHRDLVAIKGGGREFTYGQAWDRGIRLANALISMGIQPGDRVAVLEDNCVESADLYLGAAIANAVRVPLYRRNSAGGHEHMIRNTGARVVVVSPEYAAELAGLDERVPGLQIVVRDAGYESWLAAQDRADPDPGVCLDDVFIIRYSAGTTGYAKGITYTHRAWMSAARDWFYALPPVSMGDVCLHALPISHGAGYLFLPVWLAGGCNVLLPRFESVTFFDTLRDERVGYFFAVPTMIADVARADVARSPADLPDLKVVLVGGAPISARTALAGHKVFGERMFQIYGQTEAVPATFMGPREWFGELAGSDPLRSAGRVMPFAELEIWDSDGRTVPAGTAGEVVIRCDGQMTGLWEDPEQTATRIRDGWVLTGDIGRLDEHGFLYVIDRTEDLIVSGGYNIWPAELEQVISALPGVREVLIFGVPHEKWGETPLAEVLLADGAELGEDAIMAACAEQLGSFKKPGRVIFRTEPFPRSPVGKLQRKVMREPYWTGRDRRVSGS
jgi:acyl-CoA synthetase (AMP-forming)/AMP-acid ligase II